MMPPNVRRTTASSGVVGPGWTTELNEGDGRHLSSVGNEEGHVRSTRLLAGAHFDTFLPRDGNRGEYTDEEREQHVGKIQ
jgi:hypothetical protein